MGKANHYSAEMFINAIPGTGGIITLIAKKARVDWHTAKKYINDYPTVKRVYDAECEGITDMAEAKLIEAIRAGDFPAIKFYLTTKGKDRGYVERQEITGKDSSAIPIRIVGGVSLDDDV